MEQATDWVNAWNDKYWLLMIVLLIGTGLYFCWRTIMVQIRYIPEMFRAITEKPSDISEGVKGISAFKAFTISAASRVGTGNVAGVAVAITTGGPGAVFWMWLLAAIGGATSFVESTLAQLYKVRDKDSYRGGPAYYITKGLGENWRWMASLFVIAITVTYGFVFNAVQSNSITAAVAQSTGQETPIFKFCVGIVLAILAGVIIFGGVQRISAVTQIVVPIMAVAYIILGLIVLALNITEVPSMIKLIFEHAFGIREIAGAAVGTAMMQGIRRGLFSNEAGMGSTPNAAATASVSHPVKQGLIQTMGVYFDTWVVCTITAVIILLSDPTFGGDAEGTALTQAALSAQVGTWAIHAVTVIIFFLAFSSLVGNYYYAEANIPFLSKSKAVLNTVRVLVILCVIGGAVGSVPLVWSLADTFSALMATINIIAILPLGGVAVALLKNYSEQKSKGLNPVFHRDDLPNVRGHDKIECWDGSDPMTVRESDVA
ncbi:alanine/glycine:cation symporter family protein [Corynebacterium amycolatum]|uniref:alanine/glycine:cation symporter family protein n=1 Tax=Corynebacterium amycolatum TaxID=43765 RepID=UPI002119EA8F|nr:alanine/glycine:cation symporter family protein [Corynebacterium amycolatum]MCQ9166664.1 alanine:cation symporter family protein [Corynebacterium amycolatum]MCQ9173557.1 alanine:cation symporter family protein [Corynebacterium amycolatum]